MTCFEMSRYLDFYMTPLQSLNAKKFQQIKHKNVGCKSLWESAIQRGFCRKTSTEKPPVAPMMDWTDLKLIHYKISTFRVREGFDPSRDTS